MICSPATVRRNLAFCSTPGEQYSRIALGFFGGRPSLLGHLFFLLKLLKIWPNSLATSRGLITIRAS
jgi:hypothetical protein